MYDMNLTEEEFRMVMAHRSESQNKRRRMYALMLNELIQRADEEGIDTGVFLFGGQYTKITGAVTLEIGESANWITLT